MSSALPKKAKSAKKILPSKGPSREVARGRGRPIGDRAAQRAKLLKAAMSVIAEEGYAGASLRKVADRAGFTTGAVTYYFDNKESMMAAAAEHMFDEFDLLLRPARRAVDIRLAFERWFTRMATDSELFLVNTQLVAHASQEPLCAEVLARRYTRYRENLAAVIEAQQKAGSVRADLRADLLSDQLCALADGWMMTMRIEPERLAPARLEALLEMVIAYLTPPAA